MAISRGSSPARQRFPGLLALISYLYPSSQLWQWLGLGPVLFIAAPFVFVLIMWLTVILTFIQAIILNGLTEIFGWRAMWVHFLIALALGAMAGLILMPDWFSDIDTDRWLITIAAVLSCLLAGLVYWAIAGREAGTWRAPQGLRKQPAA